MLTTCSPEKLKFQRDFDAKLEKVVVVVYVKATTDTKKNNSSLEDWRKFLSKNIPQIGLYVLFCLKVDSKENFIIY